MTEARQKMWAKKVSQIHSLRVHQSYVHCLQQLNHLLRMMHMLTYKWLSGGKAMESNPPWMDPRNFGWKQVASCIQHLSQVMSHLHQMLYSKSSNVVVVEKSNAGQTGVDADNLTSYVQCFVRVWEGRGVPMIKQGRLYRSMMPTMMATRYDFLLFIFVMRGTIKVYFHIHESICYIFVNVTSIV